jgi:alpha-glucosidase (family GH31 glycosyl hydrolase)
VLEQVLANYSLAGIPLDCLWLDIEYMGDRFQTLTFDKSEWMTRGCPVRVLSHERSHWQECWLST